MLLTAWEAVSAAERVCDCETVSAAERVCDCETVSAAERVADCETVSATDRLTPSAAPQLLLPPWLWLRLLPTVSDTEWAPPDCTPSLTPCERLTPLDTEWEPPTVSAWPTVCAAVVASEWVTELMLASDQETEAPCDSLALTPAETPVPGTPTWTPALTPTCCPWLTEPPEL